MLDIVNVFFFAISTPLSKHSLLGARISSEMIVGRKSRKTAKWAYLKTLNKSSYVRQNHLKTVFTKDSIQISKKYTPMLGFFYPSVLSSNKVYRLFVNNVVFGKKKIKKNPWNVTKERFTLKHKSPFYFKSNKRRVRLTHKISNYIKFLFLKKKNMRTLVNLNMSNNKKWIRSFPYFPKSAEKKKKVFLKKGLTNYFYNKIKKAHLLGKNLASRTKKIINISQRKTLKRGIEKKLDINSHNKNESTVKKTKNVHLSARKLWNVRRLWFRRSIVKLRRILTKAKFKKKYERSNRYFIFSKKKPKEWRDIRVGDSEKNKKLIVPFTRIKLKLPQKYYNARNWLYFNSSFHMVSTKFFFQNSVLNIIFQFLDYKNLLLFLYEDFGSILKTFFKPYIIKRYFKTYEKELWHTTKRIKYVKMPFYQAHEIVRKKWGFSFTYSRVKKKNTWRGLMQMDRSIYISDFRINKYTYSKKEKKIFLFRHMKDIILEFDQDDDNVYHDFEDIWLYNVKTEDDLDSMSSVEDQYLRVINTYAKRYFSKEPSIVDMWCSSLFSKFPPYLIINAGAVKRQIALEKVLYDLDYPEVLKGYVPEYKFD